MSEMYAGAVLLVTLKCPCNVTHDSVTLMFTFLIIIIIPGRGVYPRGVGRAISHIFKSGGVEGLVISTNMTLWRLDRQTDTRKAAISDISEYTYDAKVTYFYRLLLVVTLGIPVMPRVNRDLKLIQMCMFL